MASSPDLLSRPLSDVLEAIASEAPTPGGGSVTAFTVGMAAALLEMAAASRPAWPEARDFGLGEALARAADVPLEIAATAADAAALGTVVAEHGDPRYRADAVVAVVLAAAAARAAASLVEVNLTTVADDPRLGAAHRHVDDAARAVASAVHAAP